MTSLVYALGVVLFLLGVLASIALHELGHLIPAKLFGVKVTQYFVGFGKTVWSVRRGETEYGVKLFPLGGYIRMVGMIPPAKRDSEGRVRGITHGFFGRLIADARAHEYEQVTAAEEPRLFYKKPWWQKVIVMSGGPLTNVALAVLFLGVVFMGIGSLTPNLVVHSVSDCVLPASAPPRPCVTSPAKHPDPVAPARLAGFRPGDRVVAFNGRPMHSWEQFSAAIRSSANHTVTVTVVRHGKRVDLTARPVVNQAVSLSNPNKYVKVGFLGIVPQEVRQRRDAGYVASVIWTYTTKTGAAVVHLPERMVGVFKAALGLEKRQPNSPMSVVGASRYAGEIAATQSIDVVDRVAFLLSLLGIVNLFVALFNFIPLLPLDGGHIAGALFEAIRRGVARLRGRPDPGYVDVAQLLPIAYSAAAVLLVMGVVLIWADIVNPLTFPG